MYLSRRNFLHAGTFWVGVVGAAPVEPGRERGEGGGCQGDRERAQIRSLKEFWQKRCLSLCKPHSS